jgi:hypothetical protein
VLPLELPEEELPEEELPDDEPLDVDEGAGCGV